MAKMEGVVQTDMSEAVNLLRNCHIGLDKMLDQPVRFVHLNLQTIFDELVSLYILHFSPLSVSVATFEMASRSICPPPSGISPWTYAARAYISAWIHDLYVSSDAVVRTKAVLVAAIRQYYHRHHEGYYSSEYDEFLICLNAAIRPTHVKGAIGGILSYLFFHSH